MAETGSNGRQDSGPAVALDLPSARILADQAAVIQDLQFVMDSCMRLLKELGGPDERRDEVVPLALWSSALAAYARCFGADGSSGLTVEDVENVPLQGAVLKFHQWILAEHDKLTQHPADPFEVTKIGAILTPAGKPKRRVEGVAIFATGRDLIDASGVGQLGGLASELAKQTAVKAQKQQDTVLADARKLDLATLEAATPLVAQSPSDTESPSDTDTP